MDEAKSEVPRLVYVTPSPDGNGTYSAEVSPDIGEEDKEVFMQIVNQWRDAMIREAALKGEAMFASDFDAPDLEREPAVGPMKNSSELMADMGNKWWRPGSAVSNTTTTTSGSPIESGGFTKSEYIMANRMGSWFPAHIRALPTSSDEKYKVHFEDRAETTIHRVDGDNIVKYPVGLSPSKSINGYTLNNDGRNFTAINSSIDEVPARSELMSVTASGRFTVHEKVMVNTDVNDNIWHPATIRFVYAADRYDVQYDGIFGTKVFMGHQIRRNSWNLDSNKYGYRLDESTGEFTAKTTRGGSSNAKKSRKSYRKKQRKSYKRK